MNVLRVKFLVSPKKNMGKILVRSAVNYLNMSAFFMDSLLCRVIGRNKRLVDFKPAKIRRLVNTLGKNPIFAIRVSNVYKTRLYRYNILKLLPF